MRFTLANLRQRATESAEFIDRLINHNSKSRKRNGFLFCVVFAFLSFILSFSLSAFIRSAHQKNKYSLLNKIEGPGRASPIFSTLLTIIVGAHFISRHLNTVQPAHIRASVCTYARTHLHTSELDTRSVYVCRCGAQYAAVYTHFG